MPYKNSRLCALVAMGLSLLAVTGLNAQSASSAPVVIRGDVDGDGRVTRTDAEAVRAYLVRGTLPGGRSILPAGDANGDGRVTAADAALISRFAAGVDVSRFPVGRTVERGGSGAPDGGPRVMTLYECTVNVDGARTSCEPAAQGAAAQGANGARLDVILGTPNVALLSSGGANSRADSTNEDTTTTNVALRNQIRQKIGTTDGDVADPDGIRMFLNTGPYVYTVKWGAIASSQVRLDNPDGTATFSAPDSTQYPDKPYYQYNAVLDSGQTSGTKLVRFVYDANVRSFKYTIFVSAPVEFEHGWVTIAPDTVVVGDGQTSTLTGTVYDVTGAAAVAPAPIAWSSSNPSIAFIDPSTGAVTGMAGGTVTITATSGQRTGTSVVHVIEAVADSVTVTGNVRLTFPVSVLDNDVKHPPTTVSSVGWGGVQGATLKGGTVGLGSDGKFIYNPPAGFEGADGDADSVEYTIASGTANTTGKVALNVGGAAGMIWFVTNAGDCTTRVSGCGRLNQPYSSLAAFQAENNGAGNNPGDGHVIFLYEGTHASGVTLRAQQKLIGQDASASLSVVSGITPAPGSDALPATNSANPEKVTIAGGVVLANIGSASDPNNTVHGLTIATNGATSLSGTSFGTLVIKEVPLSAENGQVLRLDGGTLSETFPSVTSTGSPRQGISLRNITGTLNFTAGSIADADSAAFLVSGGNVGATWPGNITQANNAPLLDVASHTGTLLFQTGTLNATNGTGLQFNSAQGTYTFSGTTSLGGGDAGVDITNGSAGTFNFGTGSSITNPTGTAFYVYGSAPVLVSYSGNITKNGTSAGRLVEIGEMTGGTVTFATGTLTATSSAGTGISLSNADGTVNFNGTTTLSGGDNGVDVLAASSGTITFTAGTSVTNPSGTGFNVNGSTPNLTFSGSITKNGTSAGRLVDVTDQTGGSLAANNTITFQTGTLSATSTSASSTGILLSNVDGTVNFNGTTTLNGGDAGVDVESGSSGAIAFGTGASITNPSGTAFNVNGSTPNLTFSGSITKDGASAGRLVDVTNQTGGSLAANNTITFQTGTLNSTSTAGTGILLSNVDGTVNFNGPTTLNGGDAGIDVESGTGGVVAFANTASVTNSTNDLIRVVSSTPTFTYEGSFSRTSGTGAGILVQNNTGGTITFNGNPATETKAITIASGASAGVNLLSNTGTTVNFTNGSLVVSTDDGAAFNATGGGTVNVTGTANTASATGGIAVNVANTTIGASGMEFRSVSANGGSNGIALSATGSGAFNVTGNGGVAGSGGTIQNTTGGDGATAGNGIYLDNVSNVSLAFMQINDHGNNGIRGNAISGFTLNKVRVTGANGTTEASPHTESAVNLTALTGSASVTGSYFSGGKGNNFRLSNSTGTLNRIVMTSDTFAVQPGNPTDRLLNDALLIQGLGTATVNATIQSTAFQSAGGDLFQFDLGGTSAGDLVLGNNAFSNNHSNIASGGGGVVLSAGGGGSPTFTYAVTNNTFRDSKGTALVVYKTSGTGTATGSITGNTIGVAGLANTGSSQGAGMDIGNVGGGTHTTTITGNQIRQFTNYAGILLEVGNNSVANGGQGRMKAVVQSNSIAEPSPAAAAAFIVTNGIHLNIGTNSGDNAVVCATLGGSGGLVNTVNGTGTSGGSDIRLRARMVTNIVLPGYAGAAHTTASVNSFVQGNNTAAPTVTSISNSGTGGSGFTGTCPF